MREFLKRCLILVALIVLTTFSVSGVLVGMTDEIAFVLQLLAVAVCSCLLQEVIKKLEIKNYLLEVVVEYVSILTLVLGVGVYCEWFEQSNWWMIFVYVTPIYVISYFLEINSINKNIKEINEVLKNKGRKEK